ncbi:uracil-DNA glycosylase [Candidatus Pyrohabitans sp.]
MFDLEAIAEEIKLCRKCELSTGRTKAVPGEGSPRARIMLVGEAPGREEDATGKPFVGRAGRLLTQVLNQASLTREEVFITSVIKCRPPNNRRPRKKEIKACLPHLRRQIEVINPHVILLLGGVAGEALLGIKKVGETRGKPIRRGRIYLVTYHPAAILRNINLLHHLSEDIRRAKELAYSET